MKLIAQAIAADIQTHIPKPVEPEILIKEIVRLVKTSGVAE
ncbi:hypothetical protein [Leptolyngbya sp. Cla-17]|nr:hypothetical protein [Leptolyngbya sp. Cla-17]